MNEYKYLKDINPKISYQKFIDPDINQKFYNPCMNVSKEYNRAVGFFSSSIFSLIYDGIDGFIKNDGKSKILCSYNISQNDLKAIHKGYEERKKDLINEILTKELIEWTSRKDLNNELVLLSSLIRHKVLDIKIALIDNENESHINKIFHEKLGIFVDSRGDSIVFHGSNNETYSGLADNGNYESFDVFVSWDKSRDSQRCIQYKDNFESMWKDRFPGIKVFDIPSNFSKKLYEFSLNNKNEIHALIKKFKKPDNKTKSSRIEDIGPRKHQEIALELWKKNNRIGILKHATGSGKTITGIFGLHSLKIENKDFIGTIILVPGELLLKQWREELIEKLGKENLDLILCGSGNDDWKKGAFIKRAFCKSKKHKVILSTYDTATSEKFLNSVNSIKSGDLMILADEVHRIGSRGKIKIMETLTPKYRLGLSATPERENDENGTNLILDYFNKIVDEYSLSDAINDGWLTKYFYYIHLCDLTFDEQNLWDDLSKKIKKDYAQYIGGGSKNEGLKKVIDKNVIKRARIIKGAKNKIQKAVDIIANNLKPNQKWLIYCESNNQIDEMKDALKEQKIDAFEYISSMEGDKSETIKYFGNNDSVLLSIKCLDEGVNIPTITHALIIASSQTKREYIQRRGRVLRKSANKNFSRIYDILVLPTDSELDLSNIALSEVKRSLDFSSDSENPDQKHELERMLIKKNIDPKDLIDEGIEHE